MKMVEMNHMEQGNGKRLWQGFWQLADPKIWIASTIPMAVAITLAFVHTGSIPIGWVLITVVGIYLIEIGKNAVNEYVDYKSGVDTFVEEDNKTPFSGGKKAIIEGKLTLQETKWIAIFTLILASIIGIFIVIFREPAVLWIGIAGMMISIFYTLPPFKFSYTGLGELAVGITFGPLLISGMYLVLTGSLSWSVVAIGLPIAFLCMALLWINQYPDYEADLKGNKRNWVVRIGKEKGIYVFATLYGLVYFSFVIVGLVYANPFWLLGVLTIPIAVQAVKIASKNLYNIQKLIGANAKTVMIYQLTGLAMIAAMLLGLLLG